MSDLDFNNLGIDTEDVTDAISIESAEEIASDFLAMDGPEVYQAQAPRKSKSRAQIAEDVEDLFISLLAKGDKNTILTLTGDRADITGSIEAGAYQEFQAEYSQACLHNPALRMYSHLAKHHSGKFSSEGGNLTLSCGQKDFKALIKPRLGDFKPELRSASPIVDVVLSIAATLEGTELEIKKGQALRQEGTKAAEGDLTDIASMDLTLANMVDEDEAVEAELRVLEDDALSGEKVIETDNQPKMQVSMHDLSNKAIAEYFVSQKASVEDISNRLASEGFTKARSHEIEAIVRYVNLNSSIQAKIQPKGNRGTGCADLGFDPCK